MAGFPPASLDDMRARSLAVPFALIAGLAAPAAAEETLGHDQVELAKERRCVNLARDGGRQVLVNSCGACLVVKLQRSRPGGAFPTSRTYPIPPRSRVPLSFRGPGRTRLLSETPCRGAPEDAANAGEEQRAPECIRLLDLAGAGPSLFNTCRSCRTVVVERLGDGLKQPRQTYSITGKSHVPLPTAGASGARIVSDRPCR